MGFSSNDDPNTYRGDIGDPETAGYDPIFWLHHCFIDYVFDVWWQTHDISPSNFVADKLNLPFPDNTNIDVFGSTNAWNVSDDLLAKLKDNEGVTYEGTLGGVPESAHAHLTGAPKAGLVHYTYEVNRMEIRGAFTVYARSKTTKHVLGTHFFFNRVDPKLCANCAENPELSFTFTLAEEPVITYAIGFHGKKELSGDTLFKRINSV